MLNKKAQVGDTLTWIVATIIVFVMLFFFIFGASLLGKTKAITNFKVNLLSKSSSQTHDLFLTKSLFTYLRFENTKSGNDLYKKLTKLEENGNLGEPLVDRLDELNKRSQGK